MAISPLLTDFYQLTMAQGYFLNGIDRREAAFDYFIRQNPFNGGYSVSAGLEDILEVLRSYRFSVEDLEYLASLGPFRDEFLQYLSTLRFTGELWAFPEGSPVFPHEPIIRVQGPLAECQLIETLLLCIMNFQTLIATKAARVAREAGTDNVLEFGLRRAQGPNGALSASRAAHVGGCSATSNTLAGRRFGIPVRGTHAHSWVLSFSSELESFRKFVEVYPDSSVLLVDTYDTLKSGVPNAIRVGLEMKERGKQLLGIRLDSGDLAYLSGEARRMLDQAGLGDVQIVASSDLDETIIHDLNSQGARVDVYGVGTNLVTAKGSSALTGVFKLAALKDESGTWQGRFKESERSSKSSLPGLKQVWRGVGADGYLVADIIELADDEPDFTRPLWGYHPTNHYMRKRYDEIASARPMLEKVMEEGAVLVDLPSLPEIRSRVKRELERLHPTMCRLMNPHVYKVSLGEHLKAAVDRIRGNY